MSRSKSASSRAMNGERRKKLRKRLLLRDGPLCWICGKLFGADTPTLDHVVPRTEGGSNRQDNLRLAHDTCNRVRGSSGRIPAQRLLQE